MATAQSWRRERVVHTVKGMALTSALVLSAYLLTLALGSVDYRWLGWVTLVPLFLAIRVLRPVQALGAGVLWGLSLCMFSASSAGVGAAPTVGAFVLLGAIPGIYAYFGALVTRRVGFSPLMLGFGWVGVELALQPLAWHNGLLASTQGDGLVVRTLGNLAGYILVAFLVAYVNASLLLMLSDACEVGSVPRTVILTASSHKRWVPSDSPIYLLHWIVPSQPRAPPVNA